MEPRKDCGSLLKQINDEMRKNANNAMRAQDMTLAQLEALVQLEQAPDGQHSLKELEQLLHVAQSTAAGIISRLEQKGYVEGFGDAGDRRVKLVRIGGTGVCRRRPPPPGRGGGASPLRPDRGRAKYLLSSLKEGAGFPVKKCRHDAAAAFLCANQ